MKKLTNFTIFLSLILLLNACATLFKDSRCTNGNCINGYGTYIYSQWTYVGQFKDNQIHGEGTLTFSGPRFDLDGNVNGGNKYIGEFTKNKISGKGNLYDASGKLLIENFKPARDRPLIPESNESNDSIMDVLDIGESISCIKYPDLCWEPFEKIF